MKRFFLGVLVLSVVIGLGSAGAYLVRTRMMGEDEPTLEEPAIAEEAPRDLTPIPIPIARREDTQPGGGDPFRGGSLDAPGAVVDRSREELQRAPAAQRNDSVDEIRPPRENPERSGGEIPDADEAGVGRVELAPRMAEPDRDSRYPERQAAAQTTDPDTTDDAAEPTRAGDPRSTDPPRAAEAMDRYGRPTPAPTSRSVRGEPRAVARSAAEDTPEPAVRQSAAGRLNSRRAASQATEPESTEPASDERADDARESQATGEEGTGRPGDPRLSGSQAPALTIEKTAPPEIQIGKPAKFVIKVRNAGSAIAQDVEIHDAVPQGTQFIEATPPAEREAGGALLWMLGALKPGEEQRVELQLMPTAEGEVGSVASVTFRAEASVRTLATKPMLSLDVSGPEKVMKGQQVTLRIKISNPGTGAASGVVLAESVPEGLSHPGGKELELDVGTLKPGESRTLELTLMSTAAGEVTNVVTAHGDANLQTEARAAIEVVAPALQVALAGPKRRYLERAAVHNISVSNPGTAAAKDVELVAVLPKELKFVEANNGGQFDAATRCVYWSLEELPPQETGTVALTTLPLAAGEAKLLIKSTAQQNLADQREEVVAIDGLAAINFQLSDASDPIEVGGQTSYEIRVTNQGTKAATGVRLVALVPREMKAISAEGPVRYTIEGGRVVFEPLKQLAPKADTLYSVKVQALTPGDLRLQVQVSTDDIREPITKEESTRVFGDE